MKQGIVFLLALWAALFATAATAAGHRPAEVSVGYVTQWPTPAQFAQDRETFEYALGLDVNWVPFGSGDAMNTALAENRIQMAHSQGHVPFLVGVSRGLDLTMVGIAVAYPDYDNCILRDDAGITPANIAQLAGNRIALRPGSLSHFRLLQVLEHLGLDPSGVEIVATADDIATANALQQGEVVMACASGGALRAISTLGKPLLTGAEQEALGLGLFDVITARTAFVNDHPDIVQSFMDVVEAANKQWRINPDPMRAAIARAAQMDQAGANRSLTEFRFPSIGEQKSEAWMGGGIAAYSKDLAEFLVAHGQLEQALDSYESFVTTRFLR
jgi:taurine transport system substrate-binding protein